MTPHQPWRLQWTQLRAVLRKNVTLMRRRPRDVYSEFAMPAILLGVLVAIAHIKADKQGPAVVSYPVLPVQPLSGAAAAAGGGGVGAEVWVAPCTGAGTGASLADATAAWLASSAAGGGVPVRCFACEVATPTCTDGLLQVRVAHW
jgi:hypothetical protein